MLFIRFLNIFSELCTKSLAALCRMVLKPLEYSEEFYDADLDSVNLSKKKTMRIKNMDDVEFSIGLANQIKLELGLSLETCNTGQGNDFIFSRQKWIEPGAIIHSKPMKNLLQLSVGEVDAKPVEGVGAAGRVLAPGNVEETNESGKVVLAEPLMAVY